MDFAGQAASPLGLVDAGKVAPGLEEARDIL
jgi:hypothetical protein